MVVVVCLVVFGGSVGDVGLRGYWVCRGAVFDFVQRVTSSESFVVLD
jgi:hypothetical protein